MTEHIKTRAKSDEDMDEGADFNRFFPDFIWAVRDFTLDLELDGIRTTPDTYLEHMLKLKNGTVVWWKYCFSSYSTFTMMFKNASYSICLIKITQATDDIILNSTHWYHIYACAIKLNKWPLIVVTCVCHIRNKSEDEINNPLLLWPISISRMLSGTGRKVYEYNLPRDCLRRYFPERRCFCFPRPVPSKKDLCNLDSVPVERLDEEFQQICRSFCETVYTNSQPKTIHGQAVDGSRTLVFLSTLILNQIYVE